MPVGEVMHELVNRKVSGMPVVNDGGAPIGFISDGDIMRYLSECHPAITSSYSLMEATNSQTFDEKLKELVAHRFAYCYGARREHSSRRNAPRGMHAFGAA